MPQVGKKTFKYNAEGKAKAKKEAMKTGMPVKEKLSKYKKK